MDDLADIIKEIKSWTFIKPSDDTILEVASKIFISQNIQREKNFKPLPKQTTELATDRQLYFFRNNNLTIPKGLTKAEASRIINSYKEANK